MRYQERIYIQNSNEAVRNKNILNFNMSSDICIFEPPIFNLIGASKIDCTGYTGTSYVITTATTIPLTFDFTGNTATFSANSASFKYEIYKYNTDADLFFVPPVYKSGLIQYSAFSATNMTTQLIPVSGISMDGEYLVKGFYEFPVCTEFMSKLGKTIDTINYRNGSKYGLYESGLDYFFRAISAAETPNFTNNPSNAIATNTLYQQITIPTVGSTDIIISNSISNSYFIITLNGLTLAKDYDYTLSGNVVTLKEPTVLNDIVTAVYSTGSCPGIVGTTIDVTSTIPSGSTGNEGSNKYYFNTTSGKYEIYADTTPSDGNNILVMINGATLANGVDYYQSTTNKKRMILEGDIIVGDMILIIYIPQSNTINGLTTNLPIVSWTVISAPQLTNGFFSLEVSTATTFNTLYSSGTTPYVIGKTNYSDQFVATGSVGTTLYYRVKNEKNFVTLCGDNIGSTAYSETIPIIIQTNSINSY